MADIHSLELAFARSPSLETCLPLCETYLTATRFMEAMVVCKKGIKGSPDDPRGYAMLVRVYLEQGKLPKASSEIDKAIQKFPGQPAILAMQGRLFMKQGDTENAVQALQQVLTIDPNHDDARTWLGELGVAAPQTPVPIQQPPMQQPSMQQPPMQQPSMQQPPMQQPPMQQPPMQQPPMQQPPMQQPPMQQPPMRQPPMPAGAPPAMPSPVAAPSPFDGQPGQPEAAGTGGGHVSDFFADSSLGFSADSGIETAGPGRLTIVGFVPKSTGSIKTTIMYSLALLAVAAAVIVVSFVYIQNKSQVDKLYGDMLEAFKDDTFMQYRAVSDLGAKALAINDTHELTLSAVAYGDAILAYEHGQGDKLAEAQKMLRRAEESSAEQDENKIAATALIAFARGKVDEGLARVKGVAERAQSGIVAMEYHRLRYAKEPAAKATGDLLRRVKRLNSSSPRVFNYLGWYYYQAEEYNQADAAFSSALKISKGHPQALIGAALADLERGLGLKERQVEIAKNLKKVFGLPPDELSPPVKALAHFARSQLLNWQGKTVDADKDYKLAVSLAPKNPLFPSRRGMAELAQGNYSGAVSYLKKAAIAQPRNIHYLEKLVDAQVNGKDLAGARASLERAQSLAKDSYRLILLNGRLLTAERKYADAAKVFKKIDVKTYGKHVYAMAQIGKSEALRSSGNASKAVRLLRGVLRDDESAARTDKSELWCALGQAYEASGNKKDAEEAYKLGVGLYAHNGECHYRLAKVLGFRGEGKQACKTYLTVAPRGKFSAECARYVR